MSNSKLTWRYMSRSLPFETKLRRAHPSLLRTSIWRLMHRWPLETMGWRLSLSRIRLSMRFTRHVRPSLRLSLQDERYSRFSKNVSASAPLWAAIASYKARACELRSRPRAEDLGFSSSMNLSVLHRTLGLSSEAKLCFRALSAKLRLTEQIPRVNLPSLYALQS